MQILFYIVAGLFYIMGVFIMESAYKFKFRNWGLTFGGLTYLLGATAALATHSWWVLLGTFVVAWVVKTVLKLHKFKI